MSAAAIFDTTLAFRRRIEAGLTSGETVYVGPPVRGEMGSSSVALFLFHAEPNRELRNVARNAHPLALMQVLVRAYFGCGVVCGMALEATANAEDRDPCATSDLAYAVTVRPGVALDCAGFPLELCGPICLDLTPDPCVPPGPLIGDEQRLLHIAIRRAPEVRSASDTGRCGCGGGCACSGEGAGTAGTQCSRIRDAVEVAAFLDLPEGICLADLCRRPGLPRRRSGGSAMRVRRGSWRAAVPCVPSCRSVPRTTRSNARPMPSPTRSYG